MTGCSAAMMSTLPVLCAGTQRDNSVHQCSRLFCVPPCPSYLLVLFVSCLDPIVSHIVLTFQNVEHGAING
jgi:hypothetical protein